MALISYKTDKDILLKILASTYSLYVKTQNYHWNVKGPHFYSFHTMFEEQYSEMSTAIDEFAERIKILGHYVPGSLSEFSSLSVVSDETKEVPADQMVKNLSADNASLADLLKEGIKSAEEAGDEVTVDMCVARMTVHEKNAWMLSSSI